MDAMDQLRLGLARRHGLPDPMADRISGEGIEELDANARHLVETHPNRAEVASLGVQKQQRQAALLQALHGTGAEPQEPEGPVDFDGGARDRAPEARSPEEAHNEFLARLLGL